MSLMALLKRPGPTGFGFGSTADEVCSGLELGGKTILVTGVSSGLGHESARVLGRRGAHIVGLARAREAASRALATLGVAGTPVACELADPTSVRAAIATIRGLGRRLDALVANAGIMMLPKLEQAHGIELQFFTNHVGHFLLLTGLLELASEDARVVVLSSSAHHFAPAAGIEFDNLSGARGYAAMKAYGQSKLANILFARALARRFEGSGRTANSLHPGVIPTNLSRHSQGFHRTLFGTLGWLFLKSTPQGAATQCYLAAHPGARSLSGRYWEDCNVATPSRLAQSDELAERLWSESERIARAL